MNYVLPLSFFILLGFMWFFLRRIPEWVFEHVANRSSFRSELSRISFEHQIENAALFMGESEIAELMLEMAQIGVPILSKQERHLRSAIGRTIQRGVRDAEEETVIKKIHDALTETEEVILQYRECGKDLKLMVKLAKSSLLEQQHLHIKLYTLKEQFEASRVTYKDAIEAAQTEQPQQKSLEPAEHHA